MGSKKIKIMNLEEEMTHEFGLALRDAILIASGVSLAMVIGIGVIIWIVLKKFFIT